MAMNPKKGIDGQMPYSTLNLRWGRAPRVKVKWRAYIVPFGNYGPAKPQGRPADEVGQGVNCLPC